MKHVAPFMVENGYNVEENKYLDMVIKTLRNRTKTLRDMADSANFYYEDIRPPYDKEVSDKFLRPNMCKPLSLLLSQFRTLDSFEQENQEAVFKWVIDKTGTSFGKIAQTVRVALTGRSVSPGIFEIVEVLGRDMVLRRLESARDFILSGKA